MSPEIVKNQPYNEKVDIWGIGIIAHIVLSGNPPFDGHTNARIRDGIINKKPMFGSVRLKLSEEAKEFTTSCLNKSPF